MDNLIVSQNIIIIIYQYSILFLIVFVAEIKLKLYIIQILLQVVSNSLCCFYYFRTDQGTKSLSFYNFKPTNFSALSTRLELCFIMIHAEFLLFYISWTSLFLLDSEISVGNSLGTPLASCDLSKVLWCTLSENNWWPYG